MIKTFTQEELIQFIYREASQELHEQITQAICYDSELALQCDQLLQAKMEVDKVERSPRQRAISNILAYSRNFEV